MKSLSIVPTDAVFVGNRTPEWRSWFFTALGVLCFSFTFPMTRLSLRAFDPILVALVRGAGAGVAALVYSSGEQESNSGPEAVGALGWCGHRDGGGFSHLCLNGTEVCSGNARVGAWIHSPAGNRRVWSHPRARIGFAPDFGSSRFSGQA